MMTHWIQRTAIGLVAAAMACGSAEASTSPSDSTSTNAACSIALSGARTGSPTCSNLTAIRTDNDNKTLFGFKGVDPTDTLTVAVGFDGAPVARTYVAGTDASPSVLLFSSSNVWNTGSSGPLSLTITSVKTLSSGAGLTKYEVHGTLTATLIAELNSGSVGPVTVSATF